LLHSYPSTSQPPEGTYWPSNALLGPILTRGGLQAGSAVESDPEIQLTPINAPPISG